MSAVLYEGLAAGYELLCGVVPFGLMLLFLIRGKKLALSRRDGVRLTLFALYVMAVFYVTGAGTVYDAMRASFADLHRRVNLIPFSRQIDPVGYLLNVVMFLPMGFLTAWVFDRGDRFGSAFRAGLGFSLLIEGSQLLSHRGTDVDDLILNTLGAVTGWLIFRLWKGISADRGGELPAKIQVLTVLVIFTGRFFLFHMLGLIHLIYGF